MSRKIPRFSNTLPLTAHIVVISHEGDEAPARLDFSALVLAKISRDSLTALSVPPRTTKGKYHAKAIEKLNLNCVESATEQSSAHSACLLN